MAGMKIRLSPHFVLALVILIGGSGIVGGEYFLVRWYPAHRQRVADEALTLVPYGNTGLGISIEVAKGIYKKAEVLPGEVKLSKPGLFGGELLSHAQGFIDRRDDQVFERLDILRIDRLGADFDALHFGLGRTHADV